MPYSGDNIVNIRIDVAGSNAKRWDWQKKVKWFFINATALVLLTGGSIALTKAIH